MQTLRGTRTFKMSAHLLPSAPAVPMRSCKSARPARISSFYTSLAIRRAAGVVKIASYDVASNGSAASAQTMGTANTTPTPPPIAGAGAATAPGTLLAGANTSTGAKYAALGDLLTRQQTADVARYQACVEAIGSAEYDRKRRIMGLAACMVVLVSAAVLYTLAAFKMVAVSEVLVDGARTLVKDVSKSWRGMTESAAVPYFVLICLGMSALLGTLLLVAPMYVTAFVIAGKCWGWFWEAHDRAMLTQHNLEEIKSSCRLLWGHEFVWRLEVLFGK